MGHRVRGDLCALIVPTAPGSSRQPVRRAQRGTGHAPRERIPQRA